jgi:23S rRNA (guanosine2251-2'-O)-methyltransferase
MVYLTSFHAIEERIKSGRSCGPLLVGKPGPRARQIWVLANTRRIRVDKVGTADLDRLAPEHRGIALEVDERGLENQISLEEFLEREAARRDLLVAVLDEITDPHNYGAILRSCDQFGVDLILTRHRRIAKHAEVITKTSAGTSAWVPQAETANLPRELQRLKDTGFWIYGADMEGESVYDRDLRGRTAIVLGAEGSGISRLLSESCDAMISIPSFGRVSSLNVSVAAGILFYEVTRQREKGRK